MGGEHVGMGGGLTSGALQLSESARRQQPYSALDAIGRTHDCRRHARGSPGGSHLQCAGSRAAPSLGSAAAHIVADADCVGFFHRPDGFGFRLLLVLRSVCARHDRADRLVLAGTPVGGHPVSERRTLDVSGLPPYDISNRSPLFWGQVLMCVIEGAMLCMLIATYFYLRLSVDVWPGPGVRLPGLAFSSWALLPLVVSCVGSYLASEAAKKNSRPGMLLGLGLNLGLAIIFLVLRGIEWNSLNFTWASDAHGSIVWTILFLHSYD